MEKLIFDTGVKEYDLGAGVPLRFNPSDPNVYARFVDAAEKILEIEKELVAKGQVEGGVGEAAIRLMAEADHRTKELLNQTFGGENDSDAIMGGVNLLAVADNGERVITNLFNALTPIIVSGAQRCANAAVGQARMNREQRRAMMHA